MGVFTWIRDRALPLYRSHTPSGVGGPRSLTAGPGRVSRRMAKIRQAAAEDVARMEAEDEKYFGSENGTRDSSGTG